MGLSRKRRDWRNFFNAVVTSLAAVRETLIFGKSPYTDPDNVSLSGM
jgi:hypothetical protein